MVSTTYHLSRTSREQNKDAQACFWIPVRYQEVQYVVCVNDVYPNFRLYPDDDIKDTHKTHPGRYPACPDMTCRPTMMEGG